MPNSLPPDVIERLAASAWEVRDRGRVHGVTTVGCAALDEADNVYAGCNVEHRFRSHDVHAEVNAIGTLVASGSKNLLAVLIAADRDNFTPCGSCLDWIFELGGGDCLVLVQKAPGGAVSSFLARELMPYYPY